MELALITTGIETLYKNKNNYHNTKNEVYVHPFAF
jgi:hypothetical protein